MGNPYYINIELPAQISKTTAKTETGSVGGNNPIENFEVPQAAQRIAKSLVSFAVIKSTADSLISNKINQVSLDSGATEYEQRLATVHSVASQVVGAGAALATGAAAGPVGFTMAAIGVVSSGISKLVNIKLREETLQKQQWIEDISIGMQTIRAGTTGRRGANQ